MKFRISSLPISKTLLVSIFVVAALGVTTYIHFLQTGGYAPIATPALNQETTVATPPVATPNSETNQDPATAEQQTPKPVANTTPKATKSPSPAATTPLPATQTTPSPRAGYTLYAASSYYLFYPSAWNKTDAVGNYLTLSHEFQPGYTLSFMANFVDDTYSSAVDLINQTYAQGGGSLEAITVDGHEGLKLVYAPTKPGYNSDNPLPYKYIAAKIAVKISDTRFVDILMYESTNNGGDPDTVTLHNEQALEDLLANIDLY